MYIFFFLFKVLLYKEIFELYNRQIVSRLFKDEENEEQKKMCCSSTPPTPLLHISAVIQSTVIKTIIIWFTTNFMHAWTIGLHLSAGFGRNILYAMLLDMFTKCLAFRIPQWSRNTNMCGLRTQEGERGVILLEFTLFMTSGRFLYFRCNEGIQEKHPEN